jgi:hypothetical protein
MKSKLKLIRWVLAIALVLLSIIPMRIAIAFYQQPVPQAIFVLGDNNEISDYFRLSHDAGAGDRNYCFWYSRYCSYTFRMIFTGKTEASFNPRLSLIMYIDKNIYQRC